MGANKKKKTSYKIMMAVLVWFLLLLPVFLPAIVAGGIVTSIFSFFSGAGNNGIDESQIDQVKELISNFKQTEDYTELIKKVKVEADKLHLKYSYIIIPLLLANEVSGDKVDTLIDAASTLAIKNQDNLSGYVFDLKLNEHYKDYFKDFTDTSVISIFDKLGYLFDEDLPLTQEELAKFNNDDVIYPLRKKAIVTSEFGPRIIEVGGQTRDFYHNGIDLAFNGAENTCGVSIYAIHDGVVSAVDKENTGNAGNYVYITNKEKGIRTAYFHLEQPPKWNVNDVIKKGELVGLIGNTGLSTGCHLHLQIGTESNWKNPRNYLDFDNPKLP